MLVRFIFDEFYVYRTLCLHFIQLLSNCPRNRTREADFIHRQVEMILPSVSFIQFLDFYFPFFVFLGFFCIYFEFLGQFILFLMIFFNGFCSCSFSIFFHPITYNFFNKCNGQWFVYWKLYGTFRSFKLGKFFCKNYQWLCC